MFQQTAVLSIFWHWLDRPHKSPTLSFGSLSITSQETKAVIENESGIVKANTETIFLTVPVFILSIVWGWKDLVRESILDYSSADILTSFSLAF